MLRQLAAAAAAQQRFGDAARHTLHLALFGMAPYHLTRALTIPKPCPGADAPPGPAAPAAGLTNGAAGEEPSSQKDAPPADDARAPAAASAPQAGPRALAHFWRAVAVAETYAAYALVHAAGARGPSAGAAAASGPSTPLSSQGSTTRSQVPVPAEAARDEASGRGADGGHTGASKPGASQTPAPAMVLLNAAHFLLARLPPVRPSSSMQCPSMPCAPACLYKW